MTPDELADALFERDNYQEPHANVIVSKAELRSLARAAAKIGWDEGWGARFDYQQRVTNHTANPYDQEATE